MEILIEEREITVEDRNLLINFCANGFDGSIAETANVLDCSKEELAHIIQGDVAADQELINKIQNVSDKRHIKV